MLNSAQQMILVVFSMAAFAVIPVNRADEPPAKKFSAERQLILREMRTAVAAMKVAEKKRDTLQR